MSTTPPLSGQAVEQYNRFLVCWQAGQRPRLEGFLEAVQPPERPALFRALLLAELALRRKQQETPNEQEYVERFPRQHTTIRDLFYSTAFPVAQPPTTVQAGLPTIEGYEIVKELGRGGMGIVYQARDLELKCDVALKMILNAENANEEELERFRREAQAVARINHPGIVRVYRIGDHHGAPFMVLELVKGGSLSSRLGSNPVPPNQAAKIVRDLALAMQAAHEAGIVHRDLKPGNVLLQPPFELKITDFGIARHLDDTVRTRTGQVMGTPGYMAPEQALGRTHDIGPAADIWALGVILYQLTTAKLPFVHPDAPVVLQKIIHTEPIAPRKHNPRVSRDLETIILKCLRKAPGERYLSSRELAEDLERFQNNQPIKARPVGLLERVRKGIRRRPTIAALVAAIMGLAVLSVVSYQAVKRAEWWRNLVAGKEAEIADRDAQKQEDERKALEEFRKEREQQRRDRFRLELVRVGAVWPGDPARGLAMLHGKDCPEDLRDDPEWKKLERLCKRSRDLVPAPTPEVTRLRGAFGTQVPGLAVSADGKVAAYIHQGQVIGGGAMTLAPPTARVVEMDTGQDLFSFSLPTGTFSPSDLAINVDGSLLATVVLVNEMTGPGAGRQVYKAEVWDLKTGKKRRSLKLPHGVFQRLVFAPDGKTLATAGSTTGGGFNLPATQAKGGWVVLWDARTGRETLTLRTEDETRFTTLSFDSRVTRLAASQAKVNEDRKTVGVVTVWDLKTRKAILDRTENDYTNGVPAVALSSDGKTIAFPEKPASPTVGNLTKRTADGAFRLFDLDRKRELAAVKWSVEPPFGQSSVMFTKCIAISPDGKYLATGSQSGFVVVVERSSGDVVFTDSHGSAVLYLGFVGGTRFISGAATERLGIETRSPSLFLRDVATKKRLRCLAAKSRICCVAASPDGTRLAVGTEENNDTQQDGRVYLHDLKTGKRRDLLGKLGGPVQALAWSADGKRLVAGTSNRTTYNVKGFADSITPVIKVWEADRDQTWQIAPGFGGALSLAGAQTSALAFSPDGKRLAEAVGESVRVWDLTLRGQFPHLQQRPTILRNKGGLVVSLAYAPGGKTLGLGLHHPDAAAGTGEVQLIDPTDGTVQVTFSGHQGPVLWQSFSTDGKRLVTTSQIPQLGKTRVQVKEHDTSKIIKVK